MFGKKGTKQPSAKDVLTGEVERLETGKALSFRLHETYGGWLATIELNPEYPGKGRKYVMCTDTLAGGKPAGKKRVLWDSNNPKDMAVWVLERYGEPFKS